MVSEVVLRRRAAELGVGSDAVVREYAMIEALGIISSLDSSWVLRGGTALAYGYFGIHRLSEDIDLTTPDEQAGIDQFVNTVAALLAERLGTGVQIEPPVTQPNAPGRKRVDLAWHPSHRLQLDFSWHEPTVQRPQLITLTNPFRGGTRPRLPVWTLEEIMANKWNMLDDRAEPRDLFDLWFGLTNDHIAWAQLADCHEQKYGYRPHASNLTRRNLEKRWPERLSHQIRGLPDFERVVRELTAAIATSQ
jgi:predicted nucleotidyltransferase component of viral defense system